MAGTAGQHQFAVLLAVGLTSLQLSDLRRGTLDDETWSVTDLPKWLDILMGCGPLGTPLAEYVTNVEQEYDHHQSARAAAKSGDPVPGTDWRKREALRQWAWMAEIADDVWEADESCFWCKSENAGPVMYWHGSEGELRGGGGLYIELRCEGDKRVLAVKASNVDGERRQEIWARVGLLLDDAGKPGKRPASGKSGAFKIRTVDLDAKADVALQTMMEIRQRVARICLPR